MLRFDVLMRCVGHGCHLSVDGMANAQWLLSRLSHEFVFKNSSVIRQEAESSKYGFDITCIPPMSSSRLESLLRRIPSLNVTSESKVNKHSMEA